MQVPITISGLGTSQLMFELFFGRVGVPAAQAVALSILFLALGVLGSLPGGILYLIGGVKPETRPDAVWGRSRTAPTGLRRLYRSRNLFRPAAGDHRAGEIAEERRVRFARRPAVRAVLVGDVLAQFFPAR